MSYIHQVTDSPLSRASREIPPRTKRSERFDYLVEFHKENGHCRISAENSPPEILKFVHSIRNRKRDGRLPEKEIELLDSIGFIWDVYEDEWNRMYELLTEYHKKHGDCSPPDSSKRYGCLVNWLKYQRSYLRKMPYSEKYLKLDSLGFIWDVHEHNWLKNYNKLVEFMELYKRMPYSGDNANPDFLKLHTWVTTQRHYYRRKRLSNKRLRMLERISFEWNPAMGRHKASGKQD